MSEGNNASYLNNPCAWNIQQWFMKSIVTIIFIRYTSNLTILCTSKWLLNYLFNFLSKSSVPSIYDFCECMTSYGYTFYIEIFNCNINLPSLKVYLLTLVKNTRQKKCFISLDMMKENIDITFWRRGNILNSL